MLDRTVLRDRIKDLIIERILDGTYGPGDRIREMALATELGTSQAPIREAMRDLEAMRFIESVPYKGARVRMVTTAELAETYPVRATLEELAGTMAATHVDPDLLAGLQAELDAMRRCAQAGELHEQLAHDARFHELIVEAAHNSVLLDAWRGLRIEARTLVTVIKSDADLVSIAETHQVILDAVRAGDPAALGRELRGHIEMFAARLFAHAETGAGSES
ncbi:GntR family transcriptional regulator [Nocardioides sp. STR2]|uniref:GntR family transcriptional regulator n=1 Tax=Nocardioides pini TaxID=2975053 RepID=A0ABT4CBK6_9ACTN|nr:GntR family transcriptional regulator [Nocardioides pini]MCY4726347.1 GntR family transcriptional regulator [Nocardioides pini]